MKVSASKSILRDLYYLSMPPDCISNAKKYLTFKKAVGVAIKDFIDDRDAIVAEFDKEMAELKNIFKGKLDLEKNKDKKAELNQEFAKLQAEALTDVNAKIEKLRVDTGEDEVEVTFDNEAFNSVKLDIENGATKLFVVRGQDGKEVFNEEQAQRFFDFFEKK